MNHANFYPPDCIATLQYHFNGTISKCNTFIRYLNYYIKKTYVFLPSIGMSGKSINFEDRKF